MSPDLGTLPPCVPTASPAGTQEADARIAHEIEQRAHQLTSRFPGPTTMYLSPAELEAIRRHDAKKSKWEWGFMNGQMGLLALDRLVPITSLQTPNGVVFFALRETPVHGVADLPAAWRDRAETMGAFGGALLRECARELERWLATAEQGEDSSGSFGNIFGVLCGRIDSVRATTGQLPVTISVTPEEFAEMQAFHDQVPHRRFLRGNMLCTAFGKVLLNVI